MGNWSPKISRRSFQFSNPMDSSSTLSERDRSADKRPRNLVLRSGLDGSSQLFRFIQDALPSGIHVTSVTYLSDDRLGM